MKYFIGIIIAGMMSSATLISAQTEWTKYVNNPVLGPGRSGEWDVSNVETGALIFDDGIYKIWYSGADANRTFQVGYATSPDGITWMKYNDSTTSVPPYIESDPVLKIGDPGNWDQGQATAHTVRFNENLYEMWYTGFDGVVRRIGYATSLEGILWTKFEGNPIFDIGEAGTWDDGGVSSPMIIVQDNVYKMWYVGTDGTVIRFGFATSTDGLNWTRHAANPILEAGISGEWMQKV